MTGRHDRDVRAPHPRSPATLAAGAGCTVAAVSMAVSLVIGHRVEGLTWACWSVVALAAPSLPRAARNLNRRDARGGRGAGDHRTTMIRRAAIAVFVLGAVIGFGRLYDGTPTSPTAGCPYRITSHGAARCVAQGAYDAAGAGLQEFLLGWVGGLAWIVSSPEARGPA